MFALFMDLAQVRLDANKTILDIYQNKLGTGVASWVAKRLGIEDLKKLGNIKRMSNLGWDAT